MTIRNSSFMILSLALSLTGCGAPSSTTSPAAPPSPAPPAPPSITILEVADADALRQWLELKQGKVMVVDYWATWCPPCIKEFPELVKIHERYSGQVTCVSVSCDNEGLDELDTVRSRVTNFLKKRGATFDNLLVLQESDEFFKAKGIPSVPIVEVYQADGQLAKRFDGAAGEGPIYDSVNELIESLLKSP